MVMLLLQCPHCGHQMKFMPQHMRYLEKKQKQCVYCGKRFKVIDHIVKRIG